MRPIHLIPGADDILAGRLATGALLLMPALLALAATVLAPLLADSGTRIWHLLACAGIYTACAGASATLAWRRGRSESGNPAQVPALALDAYRRYLRREDAVAASDAVVAAAPAHPGAHELRALALDAASRPADAAKARARATAIRAR